MPGNISQLAWVIGDEPSCVLSRLGVCIRLYSSSRARIVRVLQSIVLGLGGW